MWGCSQSASFSRSRTPIYRHGVKGGMEPMSAIGSGSIANLEGTMGIEPTARCVWRVHAVR